MGRNLNHETLGDLASKERDATGFKFSVVVAENLYWFQHMEEHTYKFVIWNYVIWNQIQLNKN